MFPSRAFISRLPQIKRTNNIDGFETLALDSLKCGSTESGGRGRDYPTLAARRQFAAWGRNGITTVNAVPTVGSSGSGRVTTILFWTGHQCPIPIDYPRLPLGYRAREKPSQKNGGRGYAAYCACGPKQSHPAPHWTDKVDRLMVK
jgi:hypothetical protein